MLYIYVIYIILYYIILYYIIYCIILYYIIFYIINYIILYYICIILYYNCIILYYIIYKRAWLGFQRFQRAPRHQLKERVPMDPGWGFKLQPAPRAHGAMSKYSMGWCSSNSSPSSITTASHGLMAVACPVGAGGAEKGQASKSQSQALSKEPLAKGSSWVELYRTCYRTSLICQCARSTRPISASTNTLSLSVSLPSDSSDFQFKIFWGKAWHLMLDNVRHALLQVCGAFEYAGR